MIVLLVKSQKFERVFILNTNNGVINNFIIITESDLVTHNVYQLCEGWAFIVRLLSLCTKAD